MLITAQSHWWKDIPKLWRRCAVFSLSFDYIPNYSASKQLNEAWMLRTDSVCNWTALLHFGHLIALIFLPVCECMRVCVTQRDRENDVWWKRSVREAAKSWLQGSIVSEWHHHALLEDSMMSRFAACGLARGCTCRDGEKGFLWGRCSSR